MGLKLRSTAFPAPLISVVVDDDDAEDDARAQFGCDPDPVLESSVTKGSLRRPEGRDGGSDGDCGLGVGVLVVVDFVVGVPLDCAMTSALRMGLRVVG